MRIAPWCITVLALTALAPACVAVSPEARAPEDAAGAPGKSDAPPAAPAPAAPAATPAEPAPGPLPPRTGEPPDPAREQYRHETVCVRIEEKVQPMEGPAFAPDRPVLQEYLQEYFRRSGFGIADPAAADSAAFRIEGAFEARFVKKIEFEGLDVAHTYRGSVRLKVTAKDGKELEAVEVADFVKDGVQTPGTPEHQAAVLEMRRHLARVVWGKLFLEGKTFSDAEIARLLESLATGGTGPVPVQAEDVVKRLAARRLDAVPYLLDALTDERPVKAASRYPGVDPAKPEELKVYHLADKGLEEIFQKVSHLELSTGDRQRFLIIRGWENEWRRFCPPFRSSPNALKQEKKAEKRPR